jgi:DnaD/phage-associated family protein
MNARPIRVEEAAVRKLLGAANPDAALLYLYLQGENELNNAHQDLQMSDSRVSLAAATLRQLGLWTEKKSTVILSGERPSYSERDVLEAMHEDKSFQSLYGEVQRVMGRNLNTEEMKILLSFIRYLGLPMEVISMLVSYCKERLRQKGSNRNPSLRSIEKEAYAWAERGIDSMEEAAAYIQQVNVRSSRIGQLKKTLQIYGRNLTPGEEKYASGWLEMGFDDEAVAMAYERTCLNTGNMNWAYMNKILLRWHEAGLHTAEQIKNGDRKAPAKGSQRQLDADERAAIARMMQEV